MPTRIEGKSKSGKPVPGSPKSFLPQPRDGSAGTAWDSFRDLSKARAKADTEAMFSLARSSISARRARGRYLPDPMFGEPAWEMLLALYVDTRSEARHTISSLSAASGAAATTALRWIDYLERGELVERRPSPTDKRVAFITMTAKGRAAIEAYLAELIDSGIAIPVQK